MLDVLVSTGKVYRRPQPRSLWVVLGLHGFSIKLDGLAMLLTSIDDLSVIFCAGSSRICRTLEGYHSHALGLALGVVYYKRLPQRPNRFSEELLKPCSRTSCCHTISSAHLDLLLSHVHRKFADKNLASSVHSYSLPFYHPPTHGILSSRRRHRRSPSRGSLPSVIPKQLSLGSMVCV